jgi:hypothetical protein
MDSDKAIHGVAQNSVIDVLGRKDFPMGITVTSVSYAHVTPSRCSASNAVISITLAQNIRQSNPIGSKHDAVSQLTLNQASR